MKMEMQRALFETGLVEIKMDKLMGSVGDQDRWCSRLQWIKSF